MVSFFGTAGTHARTHGFSSVFLFGLGSVFGLVWFGLAFGRGWLGLGLGLGVLRLFFLGL